MAELVNKIVKDIQTEFSESIKSSEILSSRRAVIYIQETALLSVADYLYKKQKFRFVIATGMDSLEGIEILYHFSLDKIGLILNLKVVLPTSNPEVESLASLFDASNWIEREIHELLGVRFLHHPDLKPFVSEGNWEKGEFPYRRNGQLKEEV